MIAAVARLIHAIQDDVLNRLVRLPDGTIEVRPAPYRGPERRWRPAR